MALLELFRRMARARAFEDALAALWHHGRISGEMHLGVGEEAVAAGLTAHLRQGDAVALDHRPTPVLTMLGVDLIAMLREMLGREDGLNRGRAGHMHLMSPKHLAASSGIVGSAAPLGAGFALAAKTLRSGTVAVAFFGEGAMNQGMLLETLNLAAVWNLPLVLVCKDNGWAIATRSSTVTGGDLLERARAFGLNAVQVNGLEVGEVDAAAEEAVNRARRSKGPTFVLARVTRLEGHFLGDPLVRVALHPVADGKEMLGAVVGAALESGGSGLGSRIHAVFDLMGAMRRARSRGRDTREDPMERARRELSQAQAREVEDAADAEIARAIEGALLGSGA
jgi:acetoin:2,6-dichlorophenolindophenol oxidoreductase subunit alpha